MQTELHLMNSPIYAYRLQALLYARKLSEEYTKDFNPNNLEIKYSKKKMPFRYNTDETIVEEEKVNLQSWDTIMKQRIKNSVILYSNLICLEDENKRSFT